MKKQSGVTLIALSVTLIVLMILLGMTLSIGMDSVKEARQKNYTSEVNIVGQAVAEQYIKIVELGFTKSKVDNFSEETQANGFDDGTKIRAKDGYTEYKADGTTEQHSGAKPLVFVGERIPNWMLKDENAPKPTDREFLLANDSIYDKEGATKVLYYVKCYYKLDKNDLATLRINAGNPNDESASNNSLEYIVNYYTGEVLNVNKKEYYTGVRSGTNENIVSREQTDINPTTVDFNTVVTDDNARFTNTHSVDGSEVSDLYETNTTP